MYRAVVVKRLLLSLDTSDEIEMFLNDILCVD